MTWLAWAGFFLLKRGDVLVADADSARSLSGAADLQGRHAVFAAQKQM